jgi:hypothetical protein
MDATEAGDAEQQSGVDDSQSQQPRQMASSFEALNVRIARLAIALGVSLKSEAEVALALRPPVASVPPQERRSIPERREVSRADGSAERRTAHSREELRGLLVLRYEVQKHYVDQIGVLATRNILTEVEENLLRKGFKRGDDGMDLDHLFHALPDLV